MKTATKKTNSLILNEGIQLLLTKMSLLDKCLASLLSSTSRITPPHFSSPRSKYVPAAMHTSSKSIICWQRDGTHQSHLNSLNATMCPISETNAEWHAETIMAEWLAHHYWIPLIHSSVFLFFSLSFSDSCNPHFQALPGRKDWQRDDGRSEEGSRARMSAFQKHTLWEYQHALERGGTDPMLESHHSPSHGVQVSHSCSGAQRSWHTNKWSSLACRNSSMHTVSSKGHETLNQRIRDGNAANPLLWGNSKMSRKYVIRSLRNMPYVNDFSY